VAQEDRARSQKPALHQDGLGRRLCFRGGAGIGSCMRLWPRTLGVQLIVLTVAAVPAPNLAVAVGVGMGNQRLTQSALNERVLDRAAATATTLNVVAARARAAVAHSMSSSSWEFELHSGKDVIGGMNKDEQKLAQRLKAMLPSKNAKFPVTVKF